MKRIFAGAVILGLLLAAGITVAMRIEKIHSDITRLLEQAGTAAQEANWADARRLTREASEKWQRSRHFTAGFADHTPMDEIDTTFGELQVYLLQEESPHFQATCARLSALTQAMADSHNVQWWNIL